MCNEWNFYTRCSNFLCKTSAQYTYLFCREETRQRFYICKTSKYCLVTVSYNIVRVVKSRRMRLAGHVARMGEGRVFYY
jgi:hypothetical protein